MIILPVPPRRPCISMPASLPFTPGLSLSYLSRMALTVGVMVMLFLPAQRVLPDGPAVCNLLYWRFRIGDRKSVVSGKSVSVRVDLGGRRIIIKTTTSIQYKQQ